MASKRAKKRRESVKAEKAVKQIKRDIQRANVRLEQLERAGFGKTTLVETTKNALGGDVRFKRPKTGEEVQQQARILKKFLENKGSTVEGARAISEKNKTDFAEFLRRATGKKISASAAETISKRMGDLNLSELIKQYVYREIVDMVFDIENSGIAATPENVKRGLGTTLDNVFLDEFAKRGIQIPAEIQNEVLNITMADNIDVAIDYINKYLQKKEEDRKQKEREEFEKLIDLAGGDDE